MNNRGLTFFYTFMLGMLIIVAGIAFATPIKNVIDDARTSTELDCSAPSTNFDQGLCWLLDGIKFAYTAVIILIGIAIIVAKRYIIG